MTEEGSISLKVSLVVYHWCIKKDFFQSCCGNKLTNVKTLLNYSKVYYWVASSCREKEKQKLRWQHQLDIYKQHIISRKREQTQTLNFFLVLTSLSTGSCCIIPTLECTHKIEACELSSPYIFITGVLLMTYHFSLPTRRERHPLPLTSVHVYKNFGPPVFPSHF